MSFIFKSTTTEAARDALAKALQAGGPDGRYTLPVTAEGSIGFADLRSYKVGVDFIGQAGSTPLLRASKAQLTVTRRPFTPRRRCTTTTP